ncbi:YbaB/EbfC family nucleoid-associated protein [Leptolyngbya ohadii]|uniref:YbaB/EbfC family nucleoid-associated protein n=1 Tax=Leptolyngbya ohadii TaxID=1962290 RepID=UPI000B59B846|nr:YbaB/EbfC family nucleoid-associated protein [Leptolyngbya ohadii]
MALRRSTLTMENYREKLQQFYEVAALVEQQAKQVQVDLEQAEFEGSSGKGVHASIHGTYAPIVIAIPEALLVEGSEAVAEQILEAYKSAYQQAKALRQTLIDQVLEGVPQLQ